MSCGRFAFGKRTEKQRQTPESLDFTRFLGLSLLYRMGRKTPLAVAMWGFCSFFILFSGYHLLPNCCPGGYFQPPSAIKIDKGDPRAVVEGDLRTHACFATRPHPLRIFRLFFFALNKKCPNKFLQGVFLIIRQLVPQVTVIYTGLGGFCATAFPYFHRRTPPCFCILMKHDVWVIENGTQLRH